ncbi:MAG: dihydrolipoamide acetyltransferase family protein [Gemmatimonadetes bacterium]|jgi:pyruvate dehydrogenase E2 component (dihydrolipoamide acetyltransferase)|nr:dihydrolipoamide acetyltransferase family protein [Gemmatimonadota bacterium]
MATKVVMAQLSPTMEEGKLVAWKLAEGDPVSQGDIVAEIETDKANMDVEAMGSGVLRKILVQEGATVPVGTLIGVIADPEEDIEAMLAEAAAAEPAVAEPTEEPAAASPTADLPPGVPTARDGRVKASPVARKMAAELGIELGTIPGSGPGGRIIKQDVEAAAAAGAPAAGAAVAGAAARTPGAVGIVRPPALGEGRLRDERIEASQMRKAIARRLAESIGPVPHFFLTTEIDMERALDLRAELNAGLDGFKIGVTDILLKTAAEALVRHPEVNASWEGDVIHHHGRVDLGIAVALEGGLITPVLRDADRKGLRQIAEETADLIERARARKLMPEEYQGATFSISNLGMFDIEEFTAIINPPEAAILAIGKTRQKPVVEDGEVRVRRRMRVTMSCDHRVVDGATGARFLATFKGMLENPLALVL